MYASAPLDATGSFRAVHRQFRRFRWLLLAGALLLFAILQDVNQLIMIWFHVVLDDRLVNAIVAALIGVGCTLAITRWEDRWVTHMEALEARHAAASQALTQFEAAQASAHTLTQAINQPLAIIRGVAELYRDTPPAGRDDADLGTILAQVDRAAALVRQLQTNARYQPIPHVSDIPTRGMSPPQ